ncbi:hypothetical protein [Dictyobacter formicarum]|uniref:hypothetical protein n=1 Tax=Dictyobacter formicarum TaxID=2778368 RepID=UPI0019169460|nr:hypothetical protein [Dictyobacter formicarum]
MESACGERVLADHERAPPGTPPSTPPDTHVSVLYPRQAGERTPSPLGGRWFSWCSPALPHHSRKSVGSLVRAAAP